MTAERAIEILDPEHRENYESIEPVEEACRMGMKALKMCEPMKVKAKRDSLWCNCPSCNTLLEILPEPVDRYCFRCGQALDWSDEYAN